MRLIYILIDFENVQPTGADVRLIRRENYRVRIFRGSHQNRLDTEMAEALQPLGNQVEYIKCERKGKNALDFRMAFYLGQLVQEYEAATPSERAATFIVVSKDGDLDTLLAYVRTLGHAATRVGGISEAIAFDQVGGAPIALRPVAPSTKKASTAKSATTPKKLPATQSTTKAEKAAVPPPKKPGKPDPWFRTLENLRDHPNNRPTTMAALERHLVTLLGKETKEQVVKGLLAKLQRDGVAVLKGKKLEYKIPDKKK